MGKCSKCPAEVPTRASIMCPPCHAAEVARVHARDTPPAPDYEHTGRYEPPPYKVQRGRQGRVIRKADGMS
jgi:hypothetical protein